MRDYFAALFFFAGFAFSAGAWVSAYWLSTVTRKLLRVRFSLAARSAKRAFSTLGTTKPMTVLSSANFPWRLIGHNSLLYNVLCQNKNKVALA